MVDDNLHATLRRGRPVGQTRVDGHAPRTHYGATEMQELPVRTALTDFRTGMRDPTGAPTWSLNPYLGCQHACAYCYVPTTMHVERERWGDYVLVKNGLPRRLREELTIRPRGQVYISTGTDPYQPAEAEHRVTRACLRLLQRADWPVDVLTRSPLVTRDADILADMGARVGLSIPTLDDHLRRIVEPGAPPIDARLTALRRLTDAGVTTYANYTPAHPLTDGFTPADVAATFRAAGVQWANTSPWKYQRETSPVLAKRMAGTEFEEVFERFADGRRQRGLQRALERAFAEAGLPLHHGFFNPPAPPLESTYGAQVRLEDAACAASA